MIVKPGITPVGAVARGLVAGAVGTAAMDLLLYARYRRGGGTQAPAEWEFSADVEDWDAAPAPAQVGRRLVNGLFRTELPDSRARLVNNITHWAYGVSAAGVYGLVAGSLRNPRVAYGAPFGAGVWACGYVVLPAAGLYRPITQYDKVTLAKDLSAHLVFGLTTAAVFRALVGRKSA